MTTVRHFHFNDIIERAGSLMEATIGNEIVALDVNRGQCIGLNEVASTAWRLLEHPTTSQALISGMMTEYEVDEKECARDILELLEDLHARGLIKSLKNTDGAVH